MDVITGFLFGLVAYVSLVILVSLIRGCPAKVRWDV